MTKLVSSTTNYCCERKRAAAEDLRSWRTWGTVPFGAHSVIGRDVDGVGGGVVAYGQTQVCDTARAVLLDQDVLWFQIPVGDSRLTWNQTQEHEIRKRAEHLRRNSSLSQEDRQNTEQIKDCSPRNNPSVITYSHSCHCTPTRLSFIKTQMNAFLIKATKFLFHQNPT